MVRKNVLEKILRLRKASSLPQSSSTLPEQRNNGTKSGFSFKIKGLRVPLFGRNGTRREIAFYKCFR